MKTRIALGLFLCIQTWVIDAQSGTWSWVKKTGSGVQSSGILVSNKNPYLKTKIKDKQGNQYLLYSIIGDTFYFDDFNNKYAVYGGDGYALCKIKKDGSLGWCKTLGQNSLSQLSYENSFANIFFGANDNQIFLSGHA